MRKIVSTFIIIFATTAFAEEWIECGVEDSLGQGGAALNINVSDSLTGIMIFAIFPEDTIALGSDTLWTGLRQMGDTTGHGVGQILLRSSFRKHILTVDVNPGLQDKFFILPQSQSWYIDEYGNDTLQWFPEYLKHVSEDVVAGVDSLVNYGVYDGDNDGVVDYIAICYRQLAMNRPPRQNWGGIAFIWFPGGSIYATEDTNAVGDTVEIHGSSNAHTQRPPWVLLDYYDAISATFVHEYCHHIPEINSRFHHWAYNNSSGYHFIGLRYFLPEGEENRYRSSYFSPYWTLRLEWLASQDISVLTEPVYSDTIRDYITTGDLVKYYAGVEEYFLIVNRQGLTYNEEHWPSKGIFIYHIDDSINSQSNTYHKTEDLEIADGLFSILDDTLLIADPESGLDEIDWMWECPDSACRELTGANYGDSGDAYIPGEAEIFGAATNPSSDLYSYHDGQWHQDINGHFGVRNASYLPTDSTVIVLDILANNWYDTLDGNTTWGSPTQDMGYAITGDIVVKASDTLTIEKGTTIYFQELEDNQAGGADTGKCELIVYGTLIAQGTSSDSILFVPSSEQLASPAKGDWYGIRLMPGSEGVMEYCAVRYAEYGVHMDSSSDATLSSCLVTKNDDSGIYVKEADLDLDSSTVTYNDYGVNITYDGYADIDDCDIGHNAVVGVWTHPGKLNMRGCTLESNGLMGIYGWKSIDSIYTTTLSEKKYGIYWKGEDEAVIDSCVITCTGSTGSYYGIYARKEGTANPDVYVRNDSIANFPQGGIYFNQISSDGIIRNTDVVSCETYGVYYYNTSASISGGGATERNLFYDNTYGLYLYSSSSPTVRRTRFKNNSSHGVKVGVFCDPDFGVATDFGFNSFVTGLTPQDYYDLDNGLNINPVYAIGNWWDEDPPRESEIINAVYDSFLTSDPLPAKIAPGLEIEGPPRDFSVAKVYPNPFNPTTVISFNLSSPQSVTVSLYNILGQKVRTLVDGPMPAGQNAVIWDGRNSKGEYVSSGIYLCQMRTIERQKTLKMTVLR